MDTTAYQRLKESLLERRKNLLDWLKTSSGDDLELRTGPSGKEGVEENLGQIDDALHKVEQDKLGLCTVCDEHVNPSRLEMDYTASVCIEHLSGKEKDLLEKELELSQKVQRALLPQQIPRIQGLEISAFSQPAHIVGGDYFDFFSFSDDAPGLAIADVMGKGMPASLLMASLQASLRIIAPDSTNPADVVGRLNHLFCHNIRVTKFVSMFLARYDRERHRLTYANAGHNPPLVLRNGGEMESLRPTGAAIGLVEQATFQSASIDLSPGDKALLYTDGVVEAFNEVKEEFGLTRLEAFLRRSADLPSGDLITGLRGELHRFTGGSALSDDTTVLALTVTS